nr:ribonuclease H-like domain-containing protein [Tanacetum cinerariifolium]
MIPKTKRLQKYKKLHVVFCGLECVFGCRFETAYQMDWIRRIGVSWSRDTLDIFQNILLLYFQYGVLVFTGYGILSLFSSWCLVSAAATIGNEIQNHSTTSTEASNISATPEHPVPDRISKVSSSQTNNLDNPQPDNLDENNADDIQDSTSKILQEHEEEVPRKYVLSPRSNRGVPPKRYSPEKTTRGAKYPMANIAEGNLSNTAKAFAVRNKREKDKIGTKSDKNGKRGEARKSQEQSQSIKKEKPKKLQKEWS